MAAVTVQAAPTKRFFVEMLTRDIDLADAILDLLDNCVDGILRQKAIPHEAEKPYQGFHAEVVANPEVFQLTDNCGGIPRDIATESAFRLGRTGRPSENLATVGMYGIGMKRALFKMGRHSAVTSQPDGHPYVVEISSEWLENDSWELQMVDADHGLPENGTQIVVKDLLDSIKHQFDDTRSKFLSDLKTEISRLYALIINKGFSITLNGEEILPVDLRILSPRPFISGGKDGPKSLIKPYAYKLRTSAIEIDLIVGFYRPLATEQELDDDKVMHKSSRDDAGWTIVCNDRVVLHNDRSHRTGWGRGAVPSYHNQFISIAGVVFFRSKDPWELPLNTTKRGLDTDSFVYMQTLEIMMEGMKKFTDFTNKWKGRERDTKGAFDATEVVKPTVAFAQVENAKSWIKVKRTGGEKSVPDLPLPEATEKLARISFRRSKDEIAFLSERLLGEPTAPPGQVGELCWTERLAVERKQ